MQSIGHLISMNWNVDSFGETNAHVGVAFFVLKGTNV